MKSSLTATCVTALLLSLTAPVLAGDGKMLHLEVSDNPDDNCMVELEPASSLLINNDGSVTARVTSLSESDCSAGEGNAAKLFLVPDTVQTGESFSALWTSTSGSCQASSTGNIGGSGWSGSRTQDGLQEGLAAPSSAGNYQLTLACAESTTAATLTVNEPPPDPVSITSFTFRVNSGTTAPASNVSVTEGGTLRVNWTTSNATSCQPLGTLPGWSGTTIGTSGPRDITIGATSGTVGLRCNNSADGSQQSTTLYQVTSIAAEPEACAGRRPSHWQQQTDCIFNDSSRDCRDYEATFGSWPGTSNARQFFLRENRYASFRFVPPANMPSDFQASISIEEPQFGISSTGTKIITISRCPGDFDRDKITEEMGTNRCYFRQITAGDSFLFGGLNSTGSFRCKFAVPADGQPLYLNVVYTTDVSGTPPENLIWGCGGGEQCANRFAIATVQ
jgi:hypothetical protein